MKLTEVKIDRYGPLSLNKQIRFNDFNVIYARNEIGKTLTIDVLIKFILGNKRSVNSIFKEINRVVEEPSGYILISLANGDTIKFTGKKSITDLNKNITDYDFRNIFIIRNSDLSINNESAYFGSISERLTGLQIGKIKTIKDKICEDAFLTKEKKDFKESKEFNLKKKMQDIDILLVQLETFQQEIKENNIYKYEKEIGQLDFNIDDLSVKIKSLEDAGRYEKYINGFKALEYYKNSLYEIEKLTNVSEEGLERFKELSKEKEDLEKRENILKQEQLNLTAQVSELGSQMGKISKKLEDLNKKKADCEWVKEQLHYYGEELNKVDRQINTRGFLKIFTITSFVAFLASLFIFFYYYPAISYLYNVLIFVITILGSVLYINGIRYERHLKDSFINIIEKLKNETFKNNSNALENKHARELFAIIKNDLDEYYSTNNALNTEYNKIIIESNHRKETLDKLEVQIKNCILDYEKCICELEELKLFSQSEDLNTYIDKFKKKRDYVEINNANYLYLEKTFGKPSLRDVVGQLDYFEKEIEKYKGDGVKSVKYDESLLQSLKRQIYTDVEKRDNLKNAYSKYWERLKRFVELSGQILLDDGPAVESMEHIELLICRLKGFKSKYMKKKELALKAIELFEDIEMSELKKLKDIFQVSQDFDISAIFSELTGGIYNNVNYNESTRKIEVIMSNGLNLPVESLSGGAYDQLYFLIRYLLAIKLTSANKGFFILDDPFIKYDNERLLKAINLLFNMVLKGWQILYFTAKREVVDAVNSFKSDNIRVVNLEEYKNVSV